jgi:hypothetical protein
VARARFPPSTTAASPSGPIGYKPGAIGTTGFFARDGRDTASEHPSYSWTNILYRRDVFLGPAAPRGSLPDFRNRVVDCGDTDLAWRIKEAGHRNVFVPDALVWHGSRTEATGLGLGPFACSWWRASYGA